MRCQCSMSVVWWCVVRAFLLWKRLWKWLFPVPIRLLQVVMPGIQVFNEGLAPPSSPIASSPGRAMGIGLSPRSLNDRSQRALGKGGGVKVPPVSMGLDKNPVEEEARVA